MIDIFWFICQIIFNRPISQRLDRALKQALDGAYFPNVPFDENPGLISTVTAWVNRNPELEKDVKIEILLMLQAKINETLDILSK